MKQLTFWNLPPTHCDKCGRLLTNQTSIHERMGPVCRGHRKGDDAMKDTDDFTDFTLFEPIEEGVILKRDERGVWTNIPHLVTHHSPTGFEFGYGGSGPADLALNICEIMLNRIGYDGDRVKCFDGDCWEMSFKLHQDFKRHFIACVDREGGRIPYAAIQSWIEQHVAEHI